MIGVLYLQRVRYEHKNIQYRTETLKTTLLPYVDSFPEGRPSILPTSEIEISEQEKGIIYQTYCQAEQRLTD